MEENTSFAVSALVEANELLQSVITRHRRTIAMLRKINRRLRWQMAIAHANDEAFKAECLEMCEHDEEPGGLPEFESSQT